jgi:tRNA dimethylallyltransferase
VPHHLVDIRDPDEDFSAADYARLARAAVADITARGRLPIIAGGTGLYLRALLTGLFEGPSRDPALRARLEAIADRFGNARLHRALRRVDAEAAARIEPEDRLRVIRALEVFRVTGRPLSEQHREGAEPLRGYRTHVVGLAPDREELRRRVVARTEAMFAHGLLEEVRGLVVQGYGAGLRPLQAIGYRQAVEVLEGRMTVADAEAAVVTETMRYAKRQRTWFRHQAAVLWLERPEDAYREVVDWLAAGD